MFSTVRYYFQQMLNNIVDIFLSIFSYNFAFIIFGFIVLFFVIKALKYMLSLKV